MILIRLSLQCGSKNRERFPELKNPRRLRSKRLSISDFTPSTGFSSSTGTGHTSPLLVGRENGRLEENPVEGVKSLILRRLLRNLLGFFNSGNRHDTQNK
jgi:hypothetical protein